MGADPRQFRLVKVYYSTPETAAYYCSFGKRGLANNYYDGAKATICTAVEPLIMDTHSQEEEEEFYTCGCPAHLYKDESFYDKVIEPLTELSPPLDVNTAQILAQKLLSVIVKRSKLPIIFEHISGNGREVEINFLLQMANGNTV